MAQTFGNTDRDAVGLPTPSVYVPGTSNSDFTSLQGGPATTDGNSKKSAPVAIYGPDGNLITLGQKSDVASPWNGSAGTATEMQVLAAIAKMLIGSGSSVSGAAIKAIYNAVAPIIANGAELELQLDVNGNLQININTYMAGEDPTVTSMNLNGVTVVEHRFKNDITNTNNRSAAANSGPTLIHSIALTKPGSSDWTINLYNASGASGTAIVINSTTTFSIVLDTLFASGLFVTSSGTTAGCFVVTYR